MERRTFLQLAALATTSSAATAATIDGQQIAQASTPTFKMPDADLSNLGSFLGKLDGVASLSAIKTPPSASDDLPAILQPIDAGSEKLLDPQRNSLLLYNPLEVEANIEILRSVLSTCVDLRERGQQLEMLSVAARTEILLERQLIEYMETISVLDRDNNGNILSTMYAPSISIDKPVSESNKTLGEALRSARRSADELFLAARKEQNNAKAAALQMPGSGNHFVERFDALKREFNARLVDAYALTRATHYGLKTVYGIDHSLPPISDVGYLNKLLEWSREAESKIDKRLAGRGLINVAFALRKGGDAKDISGLLTDDEFKAQRKAGTFNFDVNPDYFSSTNLKLKNPRLRGVDCLLWSDPVRGAGTDSKPRPTDFLRLDLKLPVLKIVDGSTQSQVWTSYGRLSLPLTTYVDGQHFHYPNRREVHNLEPMGRWSISFDSRTMLSQAVDDDAVMKNLLLMATISYDAE